MGLARIDGCNPPSGHTGPDLHSRPAGEVEHLGRRINALNINIKPQQRLLPNLLVRIYIDHEQPVGQTGPIKALADEIENGARPRTGGAGT